MRVLLSSLSALGHLYPLVPLAQALQRRGHDVRWASGPEAGDRLAAAGIPALAAGVTQAELLGEFWRRYPQTRTLPPREWPDVMFPKMFGAIGAPVALDGLREVVRAWPPELVIHDAAELAAPIVAATLGVPHVTHSFGALIPAARLRAASEEVAPLWQAQGLEPRPYAGCYDHLYLDIYPPRLQPDEGAHVAARTLLRPVPYDGWGEASPRFEAPATRERPLVYATFGTVFNRHRALSVAVDGLVELGTDVVVTVGLDGDPAALGPPRPGVRVERYLPQTQVIAQCDAVVSHAGSGTVLATLGAGIPQLCLPQAADQFINAGAVAGSATGLAISPDEVHPTTVAVAMARLLQDPGFRRRAVGLAAEIAAMPGPDEVAAEVEKLG